MLKLGNVSPFSLRTNRIDKTCPKKKLPDVFVSLPLEHLVAWWNLKLNFASKCLPTVMPSLCSHANLPQRKRVTKYGSKMLRSYLILPQIFPLDCTNVLIHIKGYLVRIFSNGQPFPRDSFFTKTHVVLLLKYKKNTSCQNPRHSFSFLQCEHCNTRNIL